MHAQKSYPSQGELRSRLSYSRKRGTFTWRKRAANNVHAGAIAGYLTSGGTRVIRIDKINYYANRLAWVYAYGPIPAGAQVIHRNGKPDDNRLNNLEIMMPKEQTNHIARKRTTKATDVFLGTRFCKLGAHHVAAENCLELKDSIGRLKVVCTSCVAQTRTRRIAARTGAASLVGGAVPTISAKGRGT